MKMKQSVRIFIILTVGVFIYGYLGYSYLRDKELQEINFNLYRSAKNIPYYLGNNYIFQEMNEDSYTDEKILKTTELLDEMSELNKVDYLYIIIDEKNMPVYTAIGGDFEKSKEKIKNKDPK